MLIIALVLALIGLVALVFAVVTSNELVAWVCIGASVLGVVLLIIDALRERQRRDVAGEDGHEDTSDQERSDQEQETWIDYPEEESDDRGPEAGTGVGAETSGHAGAEESAVSADGRGDEPTKS
ncbi:MAG TPA: hypothetical protein VME67_17795 [Mycobacterium sp.]|nr:hypothetical protein [Mycobacterium sp.]HTX96542.1 hypothetical protein [Mycobacterium sp.]